MTADGKTKTRVLLVEDDAAMGTLISRNLLRRDFEPVHVSSAADALNAVQTQDFSVVVSDVRLGGMTGLELCERLCARRPDVPVILITAFGDLDTAIAALRAGAHDFLPKPFEIDELAMRIAHAAELRYLRAEVKRLREVAGPVQGPAEMLGESPAMQHVFLLMMRLALSDAPVLICGETGTGKELAARGLHDKSTRREGPFVAVNCAAVPENLLESELFGHVRGAFTDARQARQGLFLEAHGGTLFLDEVAELPLALQAKLLRALQDRKVRPVGSDKEVAFDARLLAATHRDLDSRVESGQFREDLYYRLNVLQLDLPPLRARGSDVLVLANALLLKISARTGKQVRSFAPEAARKLLNYAWPGNVRELANVLERAVALAEYDEVTVADLPEKIQAFRPSDVLVAGHDPSELVTLEEVERRYILRVMEAVGGNRTRASEILKVDRKTLYTKLKNYERRASAE
ncbi:MAG: Response regulator of zinc sigma-54-dependent two-component system [Myxococcaceae bacterium]|nr:Response regulator of zinc sigma-54-dependent two-component system [Myxococcaceae bacterium]